MTVPDVGGGGEGATQVVDEQILTAFVNCTQYFGAVTDS
jgi:hypothetical protein